MKKILIISFMVLLIGMGCEKAKVKDSDLTGYKWVLSFIQDTRTNEIKYFPADAARKISIIFSDSSNDIGFSGLCNGGAGTYSFPSAPGEIRIINLNTTLIACKYVEWETYTVQNLYYAFSYKIDADNLIIYSTGAYNLYFTKN